MPFWCQNINLWLFGLRIANLVILMSDMLTIWCQIFKFGSFWYLDILSWSFDVRCSHLVDHDVRTPIQAILKLHLCFYDGQLLMQCNNGWFSIFSLWKIDKSIGNKLWRMLSIASATSRRNWVKTIIINFDWNLWSFNSHQSYNFLCVQVFWNDL